MLGNGRENTQGRPAPVFVCNGAIAAATLSAPLTQNDFFGRPIPDQ
jgi:hypothetical protein